jgi:Fe-S-cluster containining protein
LYAIGKSGSGKSKLLELLINEDIPKLAEHLGITEEELKENHLQTITKFNTTLHKPKHPKPFGKCTFYNEKEGKCTVHDAKPYQCRVATRNHHGEQIIEWFDANFFLNPKDCASLREWNSKCKHKKTIPGATIEELVPDKEKREAILRGENIKL